MKSVIPFTKELEFDTKVSEITSISLEREFNLENDSIEGNLLVTGEYKSHEVSVNILPFSFKIPFSIELSNRAIKDSISLEISDFAYDTIDDNKIKVHIELELNFDEAEEEPEIKDESNEIIELLEKEEERSVIDIPQIIEETKEEEILVTPNEETETESKEEEIIEIEKKEEEQMINETVIENNTKDEYMTYHIHILKEGESLETLCAMYHVTGSFLADYNDISNLNPGDKILIPFENE